MVPLTELFETSRVLLSGPKLGGASGDAPGLVEPRSLDQRLHEGTVLREEVDETAGSDIRYSIRDVYQTIDVLDAEH